jgi:hypothetical protein
MMVALNRGKPDPKMCRLIGAQSPQDRRLTAKSRHRGERWRLSIALATTRKKVIAIVPGGG